MSLPNLRFLNIGQMSFREEARVTKFDMWLYRLFWRLVPKWMDRRSKNYWRDWSRKGQEHEAKRIQTKAIIHQGIERAKKYGSWS